MASAFDTRNVGVTLEVEPTFAEDRKSLYLSFVAQHIRLKSVDRVVVEHEHTPAKKTEKTTVEVPRFTDFKTQTSITMKSGEQRLVESSAGRKETKRWSCSFSAWRWSLRNSLLSFDSSTRGKMRPHEEDAAHISCRPRLLM